MRANPSEESIQADFFSWLFINEGRFPDLALFHSVPNGSYKSVTARMLHKRTGLKAGVPDTHLPIARGEYIGLWIEFKSKTGKVSPEQKEWCMRLLSRGHRVELCRSWIAAANVTIEYLSLPIKPIAPELVTGKVLEGR